MTNGGEIDRDRVPAGHDRPPPIQVQPTPGFKLFEFIINFLKFENLSFFLEENTNHPFLSKWVSKFADIYKSSVLIT
jgi:hypothetical protein